MAKTKPSKVYSAAILGLDAQIVEVEADVSVGLHSFQIVGLPDKAVEESKERVSSALKNTGFKYPRSFNKRTVINLAPADLKKEGGMYDLPLALSFLLASGQTKFDPEYYLFAGELGLDGKLRAIKGVLSISALCKKRGIKTVVVPRQNKNEAALIGGVNVVSPNDITELIDHLEGRKLIETPTLQREVGGRDPDSPRWSSGEAGQSVGIDMSHISGQHTAKRALEIAAAGGHNIMMQGPPGSGKSILAKALTGILPKMTHKESLEVTQIYSTLGRTDPENPLITVRPFRAPHHSSSEAALIGGGAGLRPGEITMAHRGVLFLDEFPEVHRDVIESLRQPMEDGTISVSRARGSITFPANFMLVSAANPCPCGFLNDPEKECTCYGFQIQKYQKKLSGPIADRIDIHIEVPHQSYDILTSEKSGETSEIIRRRVESARQVQKERFGETEAVTNSDMSIPQIKKYCKIPSEAEDTLRKAVDKDRLSARGYHKVLKLARTISDLELREKINTQDVLSALKFNRS